MDLIFGFGVANDNGCHAKQPGRIEALLALVIALVLIGQGRAGKRTFGISKVKPVLSQVGRTL